MIENTYQMTQGSNRIIEKIIADENLHFNHAIFNKGEGLPEHYSNSNVYMTVIRGTLSIGLDEQGIHEYNAGAILKIPNAVKMNVKNLHDSTLELIIIKAPAPGK